MDYNEFELFEMLRKDASEIFPGLKKLWIKGIEVTQSIQYYRLREHLTDLAYQG